MNLFMYKKYRISDVGISKINAFYLYYGFNIDLNIFGQNKVVEALKAHVMARH